MHKLAVVVVVALAAVEFSGCAERSEELLAPALRSSCNGLAPMDRKVKVANYNIKSGMWTSLDDVAAVIEHMDADVVALEEVDNGTQRSGLVDQSAVLAERAGAERIFAAAMDRDGGTYGIALLSKLPVVGAERFDLPDVGNFEPRVGIDATVCTGDKETRVVSAHADVLPWAAKAHAQAIAERVASAINVLVLGDLNATPDTGDTQPFLDDGLADALSLFDDRPTFGDNARIDYILTDRDINGAKVVDSDASDHKPVTAELTIYE
jgi:endonuclease/exonuclease/phosphatase family metal-dependent hydrolase